MLYFHPSSLSLLPTNHLNPLPYAYLRKRQSSWYQPPRYRHTHIIHSQCYEKADSNLKSKSLDLFLLNKRPVATLQVYWHCCEKQFVFPEHTDEYLLVVRLASKCSTAAPQDENRIVSFHSGVYGIVIRAIQAPKLHTLTEQCRCQPNKAL